MKKLLFVLVFGFIINSSTAQENKTYYLNGQLESVGIEKNGKRTGVWKFYHGFKDGYGHVTDKTKTGPLKKEGAYNQGEETGEWKSYYRNGQLEITSNFKSGKLMDRFHIIVNKEPYFVKLRTLTKIV